MQLYLTALPGEESGVQSLCRPLLHAAYRIGEGSALLRCTTAPKRGGLMLLSDCRAPFVASPEHLCRAVSAECSRQDYTGAVLDFLLPKRADLSAVCAALNRQFSEQGLSLFVQEQYADSGGIVLISTALSGGTLRGRLQDAIGAYREIALDVPRLQTDFPLPAPGGEGSNLSHDALCARLCANPSVFFSPELCAKYFTDRKDGQCRFVLFDDADTICRKLRLGAELGIRNAFLLWSEISDLAPALFPQRQSRSR